MRRTFWSRVSFGIAVTFSAAVMAFWWSGARQPIVYQPAKVPFSWVRYSNDPMGFAISFPQDWRVLQEPDNITLIAGECSGITIQLARKDVSTLYDEYTFSGQSIRRKIVRRIALIGDFEGEQWTYRVGNFDGSWPAKTLVIPRASATYMIHWIENREPARKQEGCRALRSEVISSFRLLSGG